MNDQMSQKEMIVLAAKLCSYNNAWDVDQIMDPQRGVEEHIEKIDHNKDIWTVATMMALMQPESTISVIPIRIAYLEWSSRLLLLYRHLIDDSDAPLPASMMLIGKRLLPRNKESGDSSVETLRNLVRRTEEAVFRCSTSGSQEQEMERVRTRINIYQSMYLATEAEKEAVDKEMKDLDERIRVTRNRDNYQSLFMDAMVGYQEFLQTALKAVSSGDTPS